MSTTIFSRVSRTAAFAVATVGALMVASFAAVGDTVPAAATMKAIRFHSFGGADVLKYEDAPKPVAAAGQILVKVHAAGVNPVDWKVRSGQIPAFAATMPYTAGYDVSGIVDSVGEGVTDFKAGDEVFAYMALNRGGGYAQYVALPASEAAKKPSNIDHTHAAAVPLAALTAHQALFDTAKLQSGQTVLIQGGAGGVGHFAVQLAHAKGAKVIATASERNIEFVKSLGADTVIDYKAQKFEDIAKDVDVVFDTVGGETGTRSIATLKPGGIIVSITGMPDQAACKERGVRGTAILVRPSGPQLAELAAMIEKETLAPTIGATFPLKDAAKAHELSESGKTSRGKIVLLVK